MSLRKLTLVATILAIALSACRTAPTADPTGTPTAPMPTDQPVKGQVRVGVISSTSGLLASYGQQYVEGFRIGLEYATEGTGLANGWEIQVSYHDDGIDPAVATAHATDLIGEGVTILAGSVSSAVALQMAPLAEQNRVLFISGPAATDGVTGINRYTFRSGRQTFQDVMTSAHFIGDPQGQDVLVFAQDYAFGQANVAAVQAVLGGRGANVDSILVPLDATDFTPFAHRARQDEADMIFVAWAGDTAPAMWEALDQQGVFDVSTVVTGLDQRASYATFGPVAAQIDFLSHYFYQAPNNAANDFLVASLEGDGTVPDLFHADGFVAAQMIVRAVSEADGDSDVDALIEALEGWTFLAPKGETTVRATDHAMLQPMFVARLAQQADGTYEPELLDTVPADEVAPPLAQ